MKAWVPQLTYGILYMLLVPGPLEWRSDHWQSYVRIRGFSENLQAVLHKHQWYTTMATLSSSTNYDVAAWLRQVSKIAASARPLPPELDTLEAEIAELVNRGTAVGMWLAVMTGR